MATEESIPVPDPTLVTTEVIQREIASVKVLFDSDLSGLTRLVEEKFNGVNLRLEMAERARIEQKADTNAAVDAALTAQKEAVREQTLAFGLATAKSEAGTTKQLEQLSALFTTAINGVTSTLADVKDRVGKIENIKVGGQQTIAAIFAFVGFILTVVGIIAFALSSR